MNPFIQEQLNLVHIAKLPTFDNNTTHMIIPRSMNTESTINLGKSYIIELADYLIHPFEEFNLHDNWNNGIIPQYKYMKCTVKSVIGKMINIEGKGIDMKTMTDLNYVWNGWLPKKGITIIKEL